MAFDEFKQFEIDNAKDIAMARMQQGRAKGLKTTKQVYAELKNQGFLDKVDSTIRTMREAGSPEGAISPFDFFQQVLGKLIPAPQDVKDVANLAVDAAKNPKQYSDAGDRFMAHLISHPEQVAESIARNPPSPSTIAAALAPEAVLGAYRELTPLHVRTYLHHMAGIETPFTKVNERERQILQEAANNKIEQNMMVMQENLRNNAIRAKNINAIKLMKDDEILARSYSISLDDKSVAMGKELYENMITGKLVDKETAVKLARKELLRSVREKRGRVGMLQDLPKEEQANVRTEYLDTNKGKPPKGYYTGYLYDDQERHVNMDEAFGKLYLTPQSKGGVVTAKAIQDLYKFYPEVYDFANTTNKQYIKSILRDIQIRLELLPKQRDNTITSKLRAIQSAFRNREFQFQAPRRLAFGRPPTIVDIPLDKPGAANAYDKIAALLSAHAASTRKSK